MLGIRNGTENSLELIVLYASIDGLVAIVDLEVIDDLQSELDQTKHWLGGAESSASATKEWSKEVETFLSILASEQDFPARSVDGDDYDCDEDDGEVPPPIYSFDRSSYSGL
ncbi:hypothetical protein F0562_025421 [Nyssa sinensis]|uniref:Uncharacterized protein n=1 Tax=Nyssa sinensis TaxID=561372 RepID=A0A5J5BFL5_9ASTE|nr:hypothetical protein F0562_025421 [Nyssa sinensis]